MTLKYPYPICDPSQHEETAAWKRELKKRRQEAYSWTPEQIIDKLNNLKENIFRLEDLEEPEYEDFWTVLSCYGLIPEDLQETALEKEIYSIPEIYWQGSEKIENTLIQKILSTTNSQEGMELIVCLAMQGGERGRETLFHLEEEPRPWQKLLYDAPSTYVQYGGWTFDREGRRQILYFDHCYVIEENDGGRKAVHIGRLRDEVCACCGSRLIDILILDGRAPQLRFLDLDGVLTAVCCPNCVRAGKVAFSYFEPDGGSRLLDSSRSPAEGKKIEDMEIPLTEADIRDLSSHSFSLCEEPVSVFYGAAWQDSHTVGGLPGWIESCSYTYCPVCGKKMKHLAQIQWDMLSPRLDGTVFIEICQSCHIMSVQHQQIDGKSEDSLQGEEKGVLF